MEVSVRLEREEWDLETTPPRSRMEPNLWRQETANIRTKPPRHKRENVMDRSRAREKVKCTCLLVEMDQNLRGDSRPTNHCIEMAREKASGQVQV